jgi:hypothetical protein
MRFGCGASHAEGAGDRLAEGNAQTALLVWSLPSGAVATESKSTLLRIGWIVTRHLQPSPAHEGLTIRRCLQAQSQPETLLLDADFLRVHRMRVNLARRHGVIEPFLGADRLLGVLDEPEHTRGW